MNESPQVEVEAGEELGVYYATEDYAGIFRRLFILVVDGLVMLALAVATFGILGELMVQDADSALKASGLLLLLWYVYMAVLKISTAKVPASQGMIFELPFRWRYSMGTYSTAYLSQCIERDSVDVQLNWSGRIGKYCMTTSRRKTRSPLFMSTMFEAETKLANLFSTHLAGLRTRGMCTFAPTRAPTTMSAFSRARTISGICFAG